MKRPVFLQEKARRFTKMPRFDCEMAGARITRMLQYRGSDRVLNPLSFTYSSALRWSTTSTLLLRPTRRSI